MKPFLSPFEAYVAMYEFLGELYDTMENDTFGAVLESLRIKRETGLPVNPAMRDAWMETIRTAGKELTAHQAYALMGEFIRKISLQIHAPGLGQVITYIALHENDRAVWSDWEAALERAQEKDEPDSGWGS